jgi:biotin-(acetyl-CoA carboxylase) ligase
LAGKAGSIFSCKELPDNFRLELAEEILNNLFDVVLYAEKTQIIDEYKEKSCILGSVVKVISNSESYEAKAIDISFDGELVIEHTNGQKAFLKTGEISLKFT